jgi:hypothetical protein
LFFFSIEIRQPYKAKTAKGIVLGESAVDDVNRVYGRSKEGLEYIRSNFFLSSSRRKKIVTVIDIVEKSGIRQCKENKSNENK